MYRTGFIRDAYSNISSDISTRQSLRRKTNTKIKGPIKRNDANIKTEFKKYKFYNAISSSLVT